MEHNAAQFWNKQQKMVSKGVLYQGALERLTKIISKVFAIVRGKKVKRLFAIDNIEEQRKFLKEEWDSYFLRKCFSVLLNPFFSSLILKDPGLSNISNDVKPGNYLYERINASLERDLAKKNPLLSLILRGKVSHEAYSPYLTQTGVQAIKPRLSTLEVHTGDILEYLESLTEPTFDVFSLSDVSSYLSYPNFIRLLEGIIKVAKPGARFCLRQFMSSYEIPPNLQQHFIRNKSMEKRLERIDNCFVYHFLIGTVELQPHPITRTKNRHFAKKLCNK